jgi:hypothetical protein
MEQLVGGAKPESVDEKLENRRLHAMDGGYVQIEPFVRRGVKSVGLLKTTLRCDTSAFPVKGSTYAGLELVVNSRPKMDGVLLTASEVFIFPVLKGGSITVIVPAFPPNNRGVVVFCAFQQTVYAPGFDT